MAHFGLLAVLLAAVMPRCCVRMSKEQANFALGQRVIMGEVSMTSDSDPKDGSMAHNSPIIIVQTDFDEPARVAQRSMRPTLRN